jgi:hypothetical protein
MADSATTMPARSNRGWVVFFVVLATLAAAGVALNWSFNVRQQLKRENLEAARALWEKHRPANYDLEYTKQRGDSPSETFVVKVRGGKVVSAELDGRELERRLFAAHDMRGLFDDIERFLEMDSKPDSPRVFATAVFDATDGHLVHYVRSVSATRQRVEITVHLKRVAETSRSGAAPGATGHET